jgi:hypothetical protein
MAAMMLGQRALHGQTMGCRNWVAENLKKRGWQELWVARTPGNRNLARARNLRIGGSGAVLIYIDRELGRNDGNPVTAEP